jgi:hypothetical protein
MEKWDCSFSVRQALSLSKNKNAKKKRKILSLVSRESIDHNVTRIHLDRVSNMKSCGVVVEWTISLKKSLLSNGI